MPDVFKELVANVTNLQDDYIEASLYSPLFDEDVTVAIYLDQQWSEGISPRQLRLLEGFLRLSEGMEKIKLELYHHWENRGFVDIELSGPDDAFNHSTLVHLLIMDRGHWWEDNWCMLTFDVDWDGHGAGVWIMEGELGESADVH